MMKFILEWIRKSTKIKKIYINRSNILSIIALFMTIFLLIQPINISHAMQRDDPMMQGEKLESESSNTVEENTNLEDEISEDEIQKEEPEILQEEKMDEEIPKDESEVLEEEKKDEEIINEESESTEEKVDEEVPKNEETEKEPTNEETEVPKNEETEKEPPKEENKNESDKNTLSLETPNEGCGHFKAKINPEWKAGTTFTMNIMFYLNWPTHIEGFAEEFDYLINDVNGVEKSSGKVNFVATNFDASTGGYIFEGLNPGDEIIVFNVPKEKTPYYDTSPVTAKVICNPSSEFSSVDYNPAKTIIIEESKTVVIEAIEHIEELKHPTTDTYLSLGGKYGIKYILQNYNGFAFDDIEGTHIVGPTIAKERTYRTQKFGEPDIPNQKIITSDYSKGIFSYTGFIENLVGKKEPMLGLNYGFEIPFNTEFKPPNFYTTLTPNFMTESKRIEEFINYVGEKFISPNNNGESDTFQNDDFIDFDEARNLINEEARKIQNTNNYIEVIPEEGTGYVKLDAGKNYVINNAQRLRIVDIHYPEGYDSLTNPYPYNTFVNITEDKLAKSGESFTEKNVIGRDGGEYLVMATTLPQIGGMDHYYFPIQLIDGKRFNGAQGQGEGFEFGENNGVIFNFPNIKTDDGGLRVALPPYDILGHIIAPNAEFWNYHALDTGEPKWHGGNINGAFIVDGWHSGTMEVHMWPYADSDIFDPPNIDFLLNAKKTMIRDTLDKYDFKFNLDFFDLENIPESGVLIQNIPQSISVNEDGTINFLPITFTEVGEYDFRIKEEIPEPPVEGVNYDKSEYRLNIKVALNEVDRKFEITSAIYKVKDRNGNVLDPEQHLEEVEFSNSLGEPLVDLEFVKQGEKNEALPNAEFTLVEVVSKDDHTIVDGAVEHKVTSDENGLVSFAGLESNKVYKLVEVATPENYIKPEGYWIVELTGSQEELNVIITEYEGNRPIVDNKIINIEYDYELPATGGTTNTMIKVIAVLAVVSVIAIFAFKWWRKEA